GSSFVTTTSSAWIGTDSLVYIVAKGSAEGTLDPIYRDLRARRIYGTGFVTSSTHAYIGSDDELRVQNKGLDGIYRNVRANLYYGNALESNNGTNLYLRPSSGGEVQVTAAGTTDKYKTIRAAGFVEASSQDYKTEITPWNYDALSVLRNETQIYQYKMISDVEQGNSLYRRGVIVERETPAEFINGKGVSHYEMLNFAVRALQQLGDKYDDLEYRIMRLEGAS
ncbi:hypothetical protein, partial [Rossellomorea marisflavi]|uniref:hypothetical protein n=1 Tax=Rossellomorea marisflavi TaxID=189381 RepID=UPI0035113799